MKAKVILPGRTVLNEPRAVGDVVEVDDNTFANLVRKGVLAEVGSRKPEVGSEEELPEVPAELPEVPAAAEPAPAPKKPRRK